MEALCGTAASLPDGSSERYTETLVQLVARVREDLRQFHRGLPFVACHVRKGSKAKTTQQVNTAISRACERISNAACVPIPDGATLLSGDDFHFDGPSLTCQGRTHDIMASGWLIFSLNHCKSSACALILID